MKGICNETCNVKFICSKTYNIAYDICNKVCNINNCIP